MISYIQYIYYINPCSHTCQEGGYPIVYRVPKCHSNTEPYWITPLFAYKFILQFIGVFLAFSIRNVKIKGLNDSREVSAILYITTIILVATVLCTFVFGEYINVDGATFGTGIATATSFVLGLLFVPKVGCLSITIITIWCQIK